MPFRSSEARDTLLVDLREDRERTRDGVIPKSVHAPYKALGDFVQPGGMLHYEAIHGGKQIVFYCAYGERSVLAVRTAQEAGLDNVCHVIGGLGAWIAEGGTLDR